MKFSLTKNFKVSKREHKNRYQACMGQVPKCVITRDWKGGRAKEMPKTKWLSGGGDGGGRREGKGRNAQLAL